MNIKEINIDFNTFAYWQVHQLLHDKCKEVYQEKYDHDTRLHFNLYGDYYYNNSGPGLVLRTLQQVLNEIDISNYFCVVCTGNPSIANEIALLDSTDPVLLSYTITNSRFSKNTTTVDLSDYSNKYAQMDLTKLDNLSTIKKDKLTKSKTFCMYPWLTVHALPTGKAVPCCFADEIAGLGNTRTDTLKEIWHSDRMAELRQNLLNDRTDKYCTKCYEQEQSGIFSGRLSINKQFAHSIDLIDCTTSSGDVPDFAMRYWDIRFSNLCNLRCRSCFHLLSSSWFADTVKIEGPEYAKSNRALIIADDKNTDLVDQLLEHIDTVEQVYFAGGEPLMMDQHYRILEALEKAKRFNVKLIYNTNFTKMKLKDRYVFDYWKKFDSVSVGASLDAMGSRAELLRKECNWEEVEHNRAVMMEICPNVDFYVSATISLLNALHIPDFHKEWSNKKFIRPQDFNVNIVSHPDYLRIDVANNEFKKQVKEKFLKHLEWLKPIDKLGRATQGFISAIEYMNKQNNSNLLNTFWEKTDQLDSIRNEDTLSVIPELAVLKTKA